MRSGLPPSIFAPSNVTEPRQVGSSPEIARSSVVLPAPFAPSTEMNCALVDLERDAVEDLQPAVAADQAVNLQQRSPPGRPRSRRGP